MDDFVLSGPGSYDEWPSIREVVRVTDPTPVGRVLGVHHRFQKQGTLTKTEIDMTDYCIQSVQLYKSTKGSDQYPIKPKVFYPWYEPTQWEIDNLMDKPGVFGPASASLLMKALYCARMVRLDICYTINTLSCYVTKWNALCDKQICHLFSYIDNSKDKCLHAQMGTSDLDEF